MKNLITNLVAVVLVTVLAIGGIVWATRGDHTPWPEFGAPAAESALAPQVVTEYERDFGWRIGDVIPVQIFLKQQPGTVVDLHSLAIEGDFEMVENPTMVTRDFKDGTKYIAIKMKVQSMQAAKQLRLKVSMIYRPLDSRDDLMIAIPAIEPYTSPTWDGRDVIQDGKAPYLQGNHLWITLAWLLGGIVLAAGAWRLKKYFIAAVEAAKQAAWETRRQTARREFEEAWARFEAGDFSDESYKAVERVIRKLFRIESKVLREIEMELGGAHPYRVQTLKIFSLTGKHLYQQKSLSEVEHYSIRDTFDEIVPPAPRPTGVTEDAQARPQRI